MLAQKYGTTQANLVEKLVEFALENADLDEIDFIAKKKTGPKPKKAVNAKATKEE